MNYVVVTIAGDGSLSAIGTKTGRPFRSVRAADRVAKQYAADMDVDVLLIERSN